MLKQIFDTFGNEPFMCHQAQGFDQYLVLGAYKREKDSFTKSVCIVGSDSAGSEAKIISSHVIYKIKIYEDQYLMLKATLAPHCHKDIDKLQFRSDLCMCPPVGIQVIFSTAAIRWW